AVGPGTFLEAAICMQRGNGDHMTKYLALATGAAIAIATTLSYAQTPPGTDRPSGLPDDASSAKMNPDKKGTTPKAAPKTGAKQSPPSTDRSDGQPGEASSAKPKPGK